MNDFAKAAGPGGSAVRATVAAPDLSGAAALQATNIRWLCVVPALFMVWVVGMFDKSNISIVVANHAFLDDLRLVGQPARVGWLAAATLIAYGVGSPFWGWLTPLIGPRRAALAALAIWGLSCAASGLSPDYGALLTSRIVLGLAEGALYPVTLSLVAAWFPLRERGRATALWWIGTMIAPMITGLLITWLIVNFGWRNQFYALALIAILLPLPMIWALVRDNPRQHPWVNAEELGRIASGSIEENPDAPGRILREAASRWYGNHRYWLLVAANSFHAILFWGWSIWLPTYLTVVRHFSFAHAGYLTFVFYGAATLTILLVGRYSDRFFRRAPFACAGWAAAGLFLLGATYTPDVLLCMCLMTLSLCAQQVGVSANQMLFHSVVATRDMARSQGTSTFVIQAVGSLSPVVIGYFLKATPQGFTVGFVMLACAAFAAAACMTTLIREGL